MLENYDQSVDFHNPNCPFIPDHPYRVLIIDGSGSGKSNVFTNLIVSYRTTKILTKFTICQRSIRIKVSTAY